MSLSIQVEWAAADNVRAPELRATWCRLKMSINDTPVTLIQENNAPHSIRESLDVSAYPLAEWLALNWWSLVTPSHVPAYEGLAMAGAGDGMPWPPLRLRSDRAQMWASLRPLRGDVAQVDFLGRVETVLEADETLEELARFIEATVRRLEEVAVSGTLLQDEWASILESTQEEREFASVAAAWGFDPYSMLDDDVNALLSADSALNDPALLADLARTSELDSLSMVEGWLRTALATDLSGSVPTPGRDALRPIRSAQDGIPWREGYRRAYALREALGLSAAELAPVEDLVTIVALDDRPPMNIDGLVRISESGTGAVIGPAHLSSRRFLAARTLARRITEPRKGLSLLTRESGYSDKFERAFAAEFLAPASGISELLAGDFGEASQRRVAKRLGVSPLVVAHQIENQLAA